MTKLPNSSQKQLQERWFTVIPALEHQRHRCQELHIKLGYIINLSLNLSYMRPELKTTKPHLTPPH